MDGRGARKGLLLDTRRFGRRAQPPDKVRQIFDSYPWRMAMAAARLGRQTTRRFH